MATPTPITEAAVLAALTTLRRATTTEIARQLGYVAPRRRRHSSGYTPSAGWTAILTSIRKIIQLGQTRGTIRAYGQPIFGEGQRWELLTDEVQQRAREHAQGRTEATQLLRQLGQQLDDPDIEDSKIRVFDPQTDDPDPPPATVYVDVTLSVAQLQTLVQALKDSKRIKHEHPRRLIEMLLRVGEQLGPSASSVIDAAIAGIKVENKQEPTS